MIKYVLVNAVGSRCTTCETETVLLTSPELVTPPPVSFYICWACREVRQVGVGLVGPLNEDEEEETS